LIIAEQKYIPICTERDRIFRFDARDWETGARQSDFQAGMGMHL